MPGRNSGAAGMQFQPQAQSQSALQSQSKSQPSGFPHNMQLMQQRFSAAGASSFPGSLTGPVAGVTPSSLGTQQQQQQQRMIQQRHLQLQKLHQQKSHLTPAPPQQQQQKSLQQAQAQAQTQAQVQAMSRNSYSAPSPTSLPRPSALPPTPSSNTSTFMPSGSKIKSRPSSFQASPSQQPMKTSASAPTTAPAPAPAPASASPVIKAGTSPPGKINASTNIISRAVSGASTASSSVLPTATGPDSTSVASGADKCSPEMTEELLSKCDWNDKCLWVSRQILGGNATNGFLRATATVQRIKRQRARQSAQSKQKSGSNAAAPASAPAPTSTGGGGEQDSKDSNAAGKKREASDQAAEEVLKKEVMNPRTAKKIKSELQLGLSFCITVHNTIRSILFEMDNSLLPNLPKALKHDDENTNKANIPVTISSSNTTESATTMTMAKASAASSTSMVASAAALAKTTATATNTSAAAAAAIAAASASTLSAPNAPSNVGTAGALGSAGVVGGVGGASSTISGGRAASAVTAVPPQLPSSASSAASNGGRIMKPSLNRPGKGLPAPPLFLAGGNKKGHISTNNNTSSKNPAATNIQQRRASDSSTATSSAPVPASPGNPNGSSLRKHRKKKLPPSNEQPIKLNEFDDFGKRLFTKKEYNIRLFEVLRFRALKQGDIVAARVSSRDLWILARVLKEYPGSLVPPAEFLKLTEARRDNLFRDKVCIKDVEDKSNGAATMVARNLVLPLPRSFSEASEWCSRYKKGSRVYAMYPQTTSLYSATVTDCTSYCRDDDDIIVVEFDGEDLDNKGNLPKYHIPARFVIMIPREFPGSQTTTKNKRKNAGLGNALNTPLLPSNSALAGLSTGGGPPAMGLPSMSKSVAPAMTTTKGITSSSTNVNSNRSMLNKNKLGLSMANNNNNNNINNNNKNRGSNKYSNDALFNADLDDGLSSLVGEIPFGSLPSSDSLENLGELDFDFGDSSSKLNGSATSFTSGF